MSLSSKSPSDIAIMASFRKMHEDKSASSRCLLCAAPRCLRMRLPLPGAILSCAADEPLRSENEGVQRVYAADVCDALWRAVWHAGR
jgi:hypothetical protein